MKNRPEKKYSFLAILISFLLIASSVYAHYGEVIEIDFLSFHPTFESPDLEVLVTDKQNKAKIFVQSAPPVICFSSFFCIEPLSHFSSPILLSPWSISILRC